MKTKLFIAAITVIALSMNSCVLTGNKSQTETTVKTVDSGIIAPDLEGTYTGVIPCADCPGVETSLNLKSDGLYILRTKFIGKSDDVFETIGKFSLNEAADIITLEGVSVPNTYQIDKGMIYCLDTDGNRITGELENNYILRKADGRLVEKYWKLTEINGKPLDPENKLPGEPHVIFKIEGNRINGNGGCNTFSGTYEIKDDNRITFSQMLSTRKACMNMEIETTLLKIFETADNYTITDDGKLALNSAQMTLLAVFEVIAAK
ncbi:MAG: META domain-containing protein [Cytophagaceae bacterium]|jgi:heat shock protein HslJ|nr:META domain-containing protein [Cytophagaceae bacterium]